jgi:hypothetical protein
MHILSLEEYLQNEISWSEGRKFGSYMKSDEPSRFSYNYSDVSAVSEMIWEEAVFAYFEGRYTVPTVACIVRYQAGN